MTTFPPEAPTKSGGARPAPLPWFCALLLLVTASACSSARKGEPSPDPLRKALTFHASFDHGPNADFSAGDPTLYWAPNMDQPRIGSPGLPTNGYVSIVRGEGRFGDALRFHRQVPDMIFFRALRNFPYEQKDWSGTVSLWLRLTPDEDLAPGYTDPIQITDKAWNNSAFFVEFTQDEKPRHFRLGAYPDYKVWNPTDQKWEEMPFSAKPLAAVTVPPFRRDRWTHVTFTFANFNTGRKDGVARLYLDGQLTAAIHEREQTFTWDPAKATVMLGLSYIGLFDELSIFKRALTPDEVRQLHRLPGGVRSLY